MNERVVAVVVNYQTWQFTQACVESLLAGQRFAARYVPLSIVIVDNQSPNDSVAQLKRWLAELDVSPDVATFEERSATTYQAAQQQIIFIENTENRGYAAGNNVGLRWALAQPDSAYFWVLNNDTEVAPDALRSLVDFAKARPEAGLIGSVLRYHDRPDVVQALGGRYNRWTGLARHMGDGLPVSANLATLLPQVNYTIGAACFGSRRFLEDVGLMQEDYFLYYEDLDWSVRGQQAGHPDAVCLTSHVFHRDGGSTRQGRQRWRSALVESWFARNKLRFTRRFYPYALPTVLLSALGATLARLLTGNWRGAWLVLRTTWSALREPL